MSDVPLSNLGAERSLLGAMLLSGDAVIDVESIVAPGDFYAPAHQMVFQTICQLTDDGTTVDVVTVAEALDRRGRLADIGGPAVLLDLQATTPAISNAAHYATIVAQLATLRRLGGVGREIAALSLEVTDVDQALDRAGRLVDDLAARTAGADLPTIARVVDSYREHMDTPVPSVPTGFAGLDAMIGGWMKGSTNLVGAPSGVGKTSLLVRSTIESCRAGRPVLFHTLEMSEAEVIDRIVSVLSTVPLDKLTRRSMTVPQRQARDEALNEVTSWPLFIVDEPQPTMAMMKSHARSIKRIHGDLGVIMFDYLQLYKPEAQQRNESRQVEVANASRDLKILARTVDAPVVLGVQLNNAAVGRADRRPHMQDLRESSAPYHDASVVLMLYRRGFYDPVGDETDNETELIIRKQRNGPTGIVPVTWVKKYSTFQGQGGPLTARQFQTFAGAALGED